MRQAGTMRVPTLVFVALAAFAVLGGTGAPPVLAHHSFGVTFDGTKPVTLSGVVTAIQWANPHSHMNVDVKQPNGTVVPWTFEGYPPNVLFRTGWSRDSTMKVGDSVTVFGWRARDGSNFALGREVTLPGGKRLFFGPGAGTGEGGPVAGI